MNNALKGVTSNYIIGRHDIMRYDKDMVVLDSRQQEREIEREWERVGDKERREEQKRELPSVYCACYSCTCYSVTLYCTCY